MHPLRGERLMIVSNGVPQATMALDELLSRNGKLAILREESLAQLRSALPEFIRTDNPLDLRDDATPQRYLVAIKALLGSHDYDALLLIQAPSTAAPGGTTAKYLIEALRQHQRGKRITLLTDWCGEYSLEQARRLFTEAGIPTYRTPEGAVTAFMQMVEYHHNQNQLKETPAMPSDLTANTADAHRLIH